MSKFLIVVDMQKDFVTGCLGSKQAQAVILPIKNKIEKFDGKVIFTMDTHEDNYLDTQEGQKLPVKHCIKHTEGWEIINELKEYALDCIEKPTFASIELAQRLQLINKNEPIDEIQLVGVCTSICVISNAMVLKAYLPDTPISVIANLCACVSEDSHNAALTAMETAQINIVRE